MHIHTPSQFHTTSYRLETLFDDYISECIYSKQLRPKTVRGYKEVYAVFQKMMPEILFVKDLQVFVMAEFLKRVSVRERMVGKDTKVTGVKASTINTYHTKLIVFFRWLEGRGYLKEIITPKMVKPPKPNYQDGKALSPTEVSKIIGAITLDGMQTVFTYKRDIVLVSLLLYTGIRKGELLGLRIQDIDFQKRTLFINGATSKSKKGRFIPLHYSLLTHLSSYLEERKKIGYKHPQLIISSKSDTPLSEHGLKHWVNKYVKLSQVPFHLHRFRHTFACSLAKANADIVSIMNVMGHSSLRVTEGYLRSIKSEGSRNFIEQLNF
ncbi:tyrosine-type recombinase/integrase [Polaribacter cellanae]|uniref:Site-specific integrase n=1 Tax=Polaribacter cellanae TaxID=2818493 RepID=A0A975CKT2_9FLAO|nr:site-specific integrase [Polaribacter cellanae]QTE21070.1 site-specific integrase [Polaribacter cellanae]